MSLSTLVPPALRLEGISKSFGNTRALDDVSITLERGQILGLLGHNGSGKSTLIKCLAGFHTPDTVVRCELNADSTPIGAEGTGRQIAFVHQDLGLISDLTVVENFLLADRRALAGLCIDWSRQRARVVQALSKFDLAIDLDARIADLSQAECCLVAIVRALETLGGEAKGKVLVLDEPTPFLPAAGVRQLFTLMRNFAAQGGAIIFVAHDIDEVREITDRIVVLRDGRLVAEFVTAETSRNAVIEAVVGQSLDHHQRRRGGDTAMKPATGWRIFDVRGATVRDCSLQLARGEIVGVTGLAGSGASELPELVTGASRAVAGQIAQGDRTPVDLVRANVRKLIDLGVMLLPDDRLRKSGIGSLTLAENICLPALPRFSGLTGLRRDEMSRHVATVVTNSAILPPDPQKPLQSFSGGNQQKALIHKWLALDPGLLVLSEPTQGVDVGARQSIYAAIEGAAESGSSVLCYSSDAGELAQICDRVLIFANGVVTTVIEGEDITKDNIIAASLGVRDAAELAKEITT